MTEENLAISDELLTQYCLLRERNQEKFLSIAKSLISGFAKISDERKLKNKNESCDFNVFNFFEIRELKHSELLAFLLNPHESHGQGNLFLKPFLEKLGICCPNSKNWTVTAEKGRIDILLTRIEPHSVIIIENKSNWAYDQPYQLYRYWYYQIHKRKDKIDYTNEEYKQNYQILYLTPHSSKVPIDNSLCKPEGVYALSNHENLPDKIPIEPKIWEFSMEIYDLLNDSTNQLKTENHRLREFINQYLEIIKNLN